MFSKNKKANKKDKISNKEAFDSLLLSFESYQSTNPDEELFKMVCAADSKNSTFLAIERRNKDVELFVDHVPYIPYFKEHVGSDGNVISYILSLKDFINDAMELTIGLQGDAVKSANYQIISHFKDVTIRLFFKESDMYPSISKYITSTTADAIYKKTL